MLSDIVNMPRLKNFAFSVVFLFFSLSCTFCNSHAYNGTTASAIVEKNPDWIHLSAVTSHHTVLNHNDLKGKVNGDTIDIIADDLYPTLKVSKIVMGLQNDFDERKNDEADFSIEKLFYKPPYRLSLDLATTVKHQRSTDPSNWTLTVNVFIRLQREPEVVKIIRLKEILNISDGINPSIVDVKHHIQRKAMGIENSTDETSSASLMLRSSTVDEITSRIQNSEHTNESSNESDPSSSKFNTIPNLLIRTAPKVLGISPDAKESDSQGSSPTAVPPSTDKQVPKKIWGQYFANQTGYINGELRLLHKVTIGFVGPMASEIDENLNPFTDYRMDVTFTYLDNENLNKRHSRVIPGYFAADGNAANTGASSGNVWLVHFIPTLTGNWQYSVRFTTGTGIALIDVYDDSVPTNNNVGTSAKFFDGASGEFKVRATNKLKPDFRAMGMLLYEPDSHYYRFNSADKEYFIRIGAGSPENLLAYNEFDDTSDSPSKWSPHIKDFDLLQNMTGTPNEDNDSPVWMDGKGKGLIGALNYLSSKGANSYSFLSLTILGDDNHVYPFTSKKRDGKKQHFSRYDVSKLAQWEIVFEHSQKLGLMMHFKFFENENEDTLTWDERKLYYREMIARFGHALALEWDMGEANSNQIEKLTQYVQYVYNNDPYKHPIVVQRKPASSQNQLSHLYDELLGNQMISGVALNTPELELVGYDTGNWVVRSALSNHKWTVSSVEQGPTNIGVVPDNVDGTHLNYRKEVLWGNLMKNGAGIELFFGFGYSDHDLNCQDYRSRDKMWDLNKIAHSFFTANHVSAGGRIPFWEMHNAGYMLVDPIVGDSLNDVLSTKNKDVIVLYIKNGNTQRLDLTEGPVGMKYNVYWYNPSTGGDLLRGSIATVVAGSIQDIGSPPTGYFDPNQDWAVLMRP